MNAQIRITGLRLTLEDSVPQVRMSVVASDVFLADVREVSSLFATITMAEPGKDPAHIFVRDINQEVMTPPVNSTTLVIAKGDSTVTVALIGWACPVHPDDRALHIHGWLSVIHRKSGQAESVELKWPAE